MKNLKSIEINKYRVPHLNGLMGDENCGAFKIPYKDVIFRVLASAYFDWDHVSVSLPNRTLMWEEMCFIKDFFFKDDECVIQYHPPKKDYVNIHPYTLHLWRPHNYTVPMPPKKFIG